MVLGASMPIGPLAHAAGDYDDVLSSSTKSGWGVLMTVMAGFSGLFRPVMIAQWSEPHVRKQRQFLLLALVLTGCSPVRDDHLSGPYRLWATDIDQQLQVCYAIKDGCIGRIPATVFEVGFDDRYVVAGVDEDNDGSHINYFYVVRALDGPLVDSAVAVKGPFHFVEFEQEKARLALPNAEPVD